MNDEARDVVDEIRNRLQVCTTKWYFLLDKWIYCALSFTRFQSLASLAAEQDDETDVIAIKREISNYESQLEMFIQRDVMDADKIL